MAEAEITLPDGTEVTIKGAPEEIQRLLELYTSETKRAPGNRKRKKKPTRKGSGGVRERRDPDPDLMKIVNIIKTCDESELIELRILDMPGQVARVLLPLFVCNRYLQEEPPLTSGDISTITRELGVPIRIANVSTTLAKSASKYVIADQARRRGSATRYKISRRGMLFMEDLLQAAD